MFTTFYNQFKAAGLDERTAKKAACFIAKPIRTPEEQEFVNQVFKQLTKK